MDAYTLIERLEQEPRLDRLVTLIDRVVPARLRHGPTQEQLAGTWLGHALHPLLTDFPLGFWMSATVLDLLGARRWRSASTTLTGLGLAAAIPTVASGVVEWLDTRPRERRVGVVHAVTNSAAASLYLASLVAKLRRRPGLGTLAAVAGGLTATAGGYLGGHLSLARGVGVDRTIQQREHDGPFPVTAVDGEAAVVGGGQRYLLVGPAADQVAVPDRCTRCGGRLDRAGATAVVCPADGSRFAALRGEVERGPATTPLPRFRLSTVEGQRRLERR